MNWPMLANLDGLLDLSRRHGIDIKPTLLRVMTDFYVQKPDHPAEEERQFSELALMLIDVVDANTRSTIARTLSSYPAAPAVVMRRLSAETTEEFQPRPHQYADAGGHRRRIPASGNDASATPFDADAAAPPALADSFFAADAAERRLILSNLEFVDTVVLHRNPPIDPAAAILRLESAALGGKPGELIRELERSLGVSRTFAQRIVNDPSGEPIVVAAKAIGMPIDVLQRIMLVMNPAISHSVRRIFDLSALYQHIKPEAAHHLLSLWRNQAPSAWPGGGYQPVHWDDRLLRVRDFSSSARPARADGDRTGDDDVVRRHQRTI